MSIHEQLNQSHQGPSIVFDSLMWRAPVDVGALGNQSVQALPKLFGLSQPVRGIQPTAVVGAPAAPESTEMAWLVRHARELARHKGEWLLILGTQLVVHSRDFADVRAAIRERNIGAPFVYYVLTDDESNSVTI
jgi:hypothetical protein